MSRTLLWDGLENVRDLGGLATADGATTRFGVVVRADNVRRLRSMQTLVDHGVSRVVDLRFPAERDEDGLDELPVEVVHVSLLGEWDDDYRKALEARMTQTDAPEYLRWSYLEFLDRFRPNFGAAVREIALAPPGTVLRALRRRPRSHRPRLGARPAARGRLDRGRRPRLCRERGAAGRQPCRMGRRGARRG